MTTLYNAVLKIPDIASNLPYEYIAERLCKNGKKRNSYYMYDFHQEYMENVIRYWPESASDQVWNNLYKVKVIRFSMYGMIF